VENVVIRIEGMHCQGCVTNLTGVLSGLPGVQQVEVLLAEGEARVVFDPELTGLPALRLAIENAGFDTA